MASRRVADHVKLHGDGVRDVALWVDDATSAYEGNHVAGCGIRSWPDRIGG